MIPFFLSLPILVAASMTQTDAGSAGFPGPDTTWQLAEIDGTPYDHRATLAFPEPGRVAGQAACNSFAGGIEGGPDSFSLGQMAVTRMACPDLEAEQAYLDALSSMTSAEIGEDRLILTDGEGQRLVFTPADAAG